MQKRKIVVLGAGSFVFGPSILSQVILEHRLQDVDLVLVDTDAEIGELMAEVGRSMARQAEVNSSISASTEREQALRGADFVICSVARQGRRRFDMDYEIIQRYLPGHLSTEFGGIAGISNSLRQISLMTEIVADMRQYCPDAWLLNVSNPLPRVCQAAQTLGIKTLGFCSVALQAYAMAWQLLMGEALDYPFAAARERWSITTAGLNHFAWLIDFRDRTTGEDLLPKIHQALANGRSSGNPVSEALARETGYPLLPFDDHTRDFLPPGKTAGLDHAPFHGSPLERIERVEHLQRIASGSESVQALLQHPSWERPIDVVAALTGGAPVILHSLDMVNNGQIRNLPQGIFVETPCAISQDALQPRQITLPESVLPLTLRTAQVSATIVEAALQGKRDLVHYAVELDPTILEKAAGIQAIDACLEAHKDILPRYF